MIVDNVNSSDEWLKIVKEPDNTYLIKWNVKHVFFSSFMDDPKFISAMQNFIFAFAISEVQATKLGAEGMITPGTIRTRMNEILKVVGNGKD